MLKLTSLKLDTLKKYFSLFLIILNKYNYLRVLIYSNLTNFLNSKLMLNNLQYITKNKTLIDYLSTHLLHYYSNNSGYILTIVVSVLLNN